MTEALKLAEEAKREADAIRGDFESSLKLHSLIDRLAALALQAESEARDAARLDWLEAESAEDVDNAEIWASWPAEHDRLRTAIDAAMAEKEQTR